MIRLWRFWCNTLIFSTQYNPPRFVEMLMLLLAFALLGVWHLSPKWQYLTLALSYVVGASVSILVREAIAPSHQPHATQVTALLLLIVSIYGFADLIRYL